ncbi:MAG: HupE/UreJ family protein [Pseudomonadota bacterium]
MTLLRLMLLALALALPTSGQAHEVRPAFLDIRELTPESYEVFWKVPVGGRAPRELTVALPENCADATPRVATRGGNSFAERWTVDCAGGLSGKVVEILSPERALIETIGRVEMADGRSQSVRLLAGTTSFTVMDDSTFWGVAATYLPLGVDHILFGFDHLCFVLALLFLVQDTRRLIWAITAFTVAHSITLVLASLGHVSVPGAPVEALIALSIVLIAAEALAARRGELSPTALRPWKVSFAFGLLHGLGFAGALTDTGLPADAIPAALLFFNIGVEIGQLIFVAMVLSLCWVVRRVSLSAYTGGVTAALYVVGSIAAFWTIERVAGIVS